VRRDLALLLVAFGLAAGACGRSPRRESRAAGQEPTAQAGYKVACSGIGIGDSVARALPDSECHAFSARADSFLKAREDSAYISSYRGGSLGRRVRADYYTRRRGREPVELYYVILWRGQPGWFERPGAFVGASANSAWAGPWDRGHRRTVGFAGGPVSWEYDEIGRVLRILGREIVLTTDNVVLVDRVDGVGGEAVVVGTARVARHHASPRIDLDALSRGSPEIQRFVR
jgi:hypothetical protein